MMMISFTEICWIFQCLFRINSRWIRSMPRKSLCFRSSGSAWPISVDGWLQIKSGKLQKKDSADILFDEADRDWGQTGWKWCVIYLIAISLNSTFDAIPIIGDDVDLLVLLTALATSQYYLLLRKPVKGKTGERWFRRIVWNINN